ncbi:MAG: hypothetical protein DGJ47_000055 [Rickettsiaceae bacterium]
MYKTFPWLAIFIVLTTIIYIISDVITPFLIAFIFAYMLQPAVDSYCKKFNTPRGRAVFYIFVLFLSIVITLFILISPIIYHQIALFIKKLPKYKDNFDQAISFWSLKIETINPDVAQQISDYAQQITNNVVNIFSAMANHLWQYTMATINFFTICVLVPFILYYFLLDWPKMVKSVESILPLKKQDKTREIFLSINRLLSAYIRGQLNICLILMVYYAVFLTILGVDFAILLALCAGLLILIPFVGAFISYILIMCSCYVSFGIGVEMGYATTLFVMAHILEGYFLTPKIIGNRLGLHPLWVIFSVLLSANLFGFVGIFFALPVAGILNILWSHVVSYYKTSYIYND